MNDVADRLHTQRHPAHAWFVHPETVTAPILLARYAAELSAEERARLARFKFARDRHLFLVSHALVRRALSAYASVQLDTEIEPAAWQFSAGQHGRPEIAAPALDARLRFNLSHTDGLAACVVTVDADCGIDVEKLRLPQNALAIAAKLFSPAEHAVLAGLSDAALTDAFIRYWTLREAFAKATGWGLSQPMDTLEFNAIKVDHYQLVLDGQRSAAWQFSLFRPTPTHILAVALHAGTGIQGKTVSFTSAEDLPGWTATT